MTNKSEDFRPCFRKTPPEGVVELITALGSGRSMVELTDGSLFLVDRYEYRTSTNAGESWTAPEPLPEGVAGTSLLRLQSGAIALTSGDQFSFETKNKLWISPDEGKTWQSRGNIPLLGFPYPNTMIQLSNGRLVFPSRIAYCQHHHPELLPRNASSYGTWRGRKVQVGGHYHWPEISIAAVSCSDDEGKTWQLCTDYGKGALMGWFDENGTPNGRGGVTCVDEPSVAETKDGRLLLFARSTVGRIVYSYSEDNSDTWSAVRPTELANSYSPPYLVRIPQTQDLLCIWNQVSRNEIRLGYKRCRLSVALSKDCGISWQNFKTLEVGAGLADVDYIAPEYPTTPIIAEPNVGVIPDNYAIFHYPSICFAKDKVYIVYARLWLGLQEDTGARLESSDPDKVEYDAERVLRIYPLEYFYS